MGVHTGDSVTVAPQMTLSDEAYQELRDAAAAIIRAVGVETGGSNIQFARDRETGEHPRDRDEPARLALVRARVEGDRLPDREGRGEARRRLHARRDPERPDGTTPASFEPTLDYVVVKFPRFAFEKFPGADTTLGTQMKSVGEAMGIGRTFREAFVKAARAASSTGAGRRGRPGRTCTRGPHPWFAARARRTARDSSHDAGTRVYRRVDSCAGEVEAASNYFYSTWGEADEALPASRAARRHPRQRPEPDRPGDRVRLLLRPRGAELPRAGLRGGDGQLQPGDGLDRLRHVRPALLRAARREEPCSPSASASSPRASCIQFGGQTPLKLARGDRGGRLPRSSARRSTRSTSPRTASASAASLDRARHPLPGVGDRATTCGRGGRGRGADRLSGARAAVVRPRRARDARLLRRGAGASTRSRERRPGRRSSTASSRTRSRSTSTRSPTATRHVRRRRDAARRGGRRPLGRLVVRAAGAVARPPRPAPRSATSSAGSRAALGVVGLLNVQLAIAGRRALRARGRTRARRGRCRSRRRRPASTSSRPRAGSPRARARRARAAARAAARDRSASRRPCCRSRASPAPTRCSAPRCARPAR